MMRCAAAGAFHLCRRRNLRVSTSPLPSQAGKQLSNTTTAATLFEHISGQLSESMTVKVSAKFDAGNVEIVDVSDPKNIQLKIRPDPYCKGDDITHFQWFHFRVTGVQNQHLVVKLVNAGESSFPVAWPGYRACASYDLKDWFRVNTTWDEKAGVIQMEHMSNHDAIYFAYFPPYSYVRHQELIARTHAKKNVRLEVIGETLDGYDLDVLRIGHPGKNKRVIWMVARQHPGEAMAEWFVEGFLDRLTDPHDGASMRVLEHAVFYVMPNVNPDGSIRGHLRTNATGANLNREWKDPTPERSPEVYHLLKKMDAVGCDLFLDIHGDEEIPFNFLAGSEGIPSFNERLKELQNTFMTAFVRASPDFQPKAGYTVDEPGKANLAISSNGVGERFKCLSYTLEMPFKDTQDHPDNVHGWSTDRARHFGASILQPIYEVVPKLRQPVHKKEEDITVVHA